MTGLPLSGRRIVVTRRPEQSGALVSGLAALGAEVLEVPTLAVAPPEDPAPLDAALGELHRYDWVVFTSRNAVVAVKDRLRHLGADATPVGRALLVASVGPTTTEAVRECFPGASVALEPEAAFRAEGLAEAFLSRGVQGERFLLPVSDRAASVLAEAIAGGGGRVDSPVAYRTIAPEGLSETFRRLVARGFDMLTFASPSSVENLEAAFPLLPTLSGALKAAVIGPVTEAAARRAGFDVAVVAKPSTAEGLLAGIAEFYARRS